MNTSKDDNIDICITLCKHGWSEIFFKIDDFHIDLLVTHVFNNPYANLINALSLLLKKQNCSVVFYSEPNGAKLDFELEADTVKCTIYDLNVEPYEDISEKHQTLMKEFWISKYQLLTLFYFQFEKLSYLLQDPTYAEDRNKDFPFSEYKDFKKTMLKSVLVR